MTMTDIREQDTTSNFVAERGPCNRCGHPSVGHGAHPVDGHGWLGAPPTPQQTTQTLAASVPQTRNEVIAERAEQGEDLTAIGSDYNMSRERVRQIVAKTSLKTNDEIRAARHALREQGRVERESEKTTHVREVAAANPSATLSTLVDLTGLNLSVVRDALDWTERERRADQQNYPSVPDAEVLDEVRRVAGMPGGMPLTGAFYDDNRDGGVSHARLLQRFGTWTSACEAAGVVGRGPNPGRTYTRNWTETNMVQWVWNYLASTQAPSYARFEVWLRIQQGAPSAQTIRNTLGSWVEMKRRAIEVHATS